MNFQRYLFLFLRYSWLVVILVAGALAGAWAWLNTQSPVYASRSVLKVVLEKSQVMDTIKDVKDTSITTMDSLNTVVQSLTSNTIMLNVAKAIGRAEEYAKKSPTGTVTPEMESSLAQSVRNQLTVGLRRGTRLIDIVAEDGSAEKARNLAENVVNEFLRLQNQDIDDVSNSANKFLLEQATLLKRKLEESENKLADYRLKHNQVSLNDRQNIIVERLSAVNAQVTEASTKRAALEADLQNLTKILPDDMVGMLKIPSVAALPEVAALKNTVTSKEAEFTGLKERYLELHPKYIAALSELNDLRSRLKKVVSEAGTTLRQQYQNVEDTEQKLKAMLAEQEQRALELEQTSIPYNSLQREVATDKAMYDAVLTRFKETGVTRGLTKTPYLIDELAMVNPLPVRPNRPKTMITAALLALALGVGIILLLDRMDSSVRTVDDAETAFNLPVLAAVPEADMSKLSAQGIVMTEAADSSQAEAFRTLRASISLLGEESKRRLLLVTSAIPSEGKTFTSTNLAAALASQGLKTLIIDADLRRPALSAAMLGNSQRKEEEYRGLTDVLSKLCDAKDAIRPTEIKNLDLLPSGRRAPNPSELLSQHDVPAFLRGMLDTYDRVIVDSAPINAVSDSLSLAPHVHAVCVVLRFGKTPRRAVQRALGQLEKAGTRIAGLIMNRMPTRRGAAYYYYYYGDPYTKDSVYGAEKRGKTRQKSDKMPKLADAK